jgi:hypothetical protein
LVIVVLLVSRATPVVAHLLVSGAGLSFSTGQDSDPSLAALREALERISDQVV